MKSGVTELTEEMIDAPRSFLMIYGSLPGLTTKQARNHCIMCGESVDHWPDWAKEPHDEFITKSGAAILIWTMMEHARLTGPQPKASTEERLQEIMKHLVDND